MSKSVTPFLPYGHQQIDDSDVAAIEAVLRGDWLTTGPAVAAFEEAFGERVGASFAISCSSGTAALHMAAMALDLEHGDAIVVPSLTFLATANSARFVGADVIFADVDADTGLMRPQDLEDAMNRAAAAGLRVKAAIPVHINGQCVDLPAIEEIATSRNLSLVEDACHVVGGRYSGGDGDWIPVGACRHSLMSVFSMHPVKSMTMGEGGVVTTNDELLYARLKRLRNHGIVRDPDMFEHPEMALDESGQVNPWYYEMPELGLNYRASDINCALGLSQLAKLDGFVARRKDLVEYYDERVGPLSPLVTRLSRCDHSDPAWHLYVVHIDFKNAGISRSVVMRTMREAGIGTQVHYIPVHMQPYYQRLYGSLELPGAEAYYAGALSLPLFPGMKRADVDRVVDALSTVLSI